MNVVADTSPLSYLIRLGRVDVLASIYGHIALPSAVVNELAHPNAPPEVRQWVLSPPAWIEQAQVKRLDDSLPEDLGAGEREAISLALERRADLLLIDDFAGRTQAEARNIPVVGTLALLLQASLLTSFDFPGEVERLRQIGFRVSPRVEAYMLARHASMRGQL